MIIPDSVIGEIWRSLDGFQFDVIHLAKDTTVLTVKLEELSKNSSSAVRAAVAGNVRTPVEILAVLLQDEAQGVRYSAAKNPGIGVEVSHQLVSSPDESVRLGLAGNPISDVSVLAVLLKDEKPEVQTQARIVLENMSEEEFAEGLVEAGFMNLVHVPRKWALKALGANY